MTRARTAVLAVAVLLVGLTGCSGSSSDSRSMSADAEALAQSDVGGANAKSAALEERVFIKTGRVSLRTKDVAKTQRAVTAITAEHGGSVSNQSSHSDDDGELAAAELTLRVPSDDFDAVVAALQDSAELISVTTSAEDVTTQKIDNDVRVRAQRRTLRRIEQLLDRATSMRDIIAIEADLGQRQAELDSLVQQQTWLADQTSLATIEVSVSRKDPGTIADRGGFVGGLATGWNTLVAFGGAAVTALGVLLPWLAVLALILLPLRWLLRRRPTGR